jgi:hypothetical protein
VTPVYVASDIVEEEGTTQEARQEVAFDFVEYDDVTTGQGVATLTCQGADNVVNLPAAQTGNSAQAIRGVRMASADGKDYQIVQPLGNAAQDDGYYTIHFPEGYFLLGADKTPSPSFELSFTVGVVASLTDITADCNDGEAEYFTLQGIKVAGNPTTGIYIRRQGSKVSKVLIK